MDLSFIPKWGGKMGGVPNIQGKTVVLELPADLVDVLKREARRTRQSIAGYLAASIERQKEEDEDFKDIQAAKRKAATPVPLNEAKRILGLAN